MLKKIALAGLIVVATALGGTAVAKSSVTKSSKPVVTQPAPQNFCWSIRC